MEIIFSYLDYRKYLQDFQAERQQRHPSYSVRAFLQKAEITSPSFFRQVIDGKRNLTATATEKFLRAMGLKAAEEEYFRELVLYGQAETSTEKQSHYLRLLQLGEKAKVKLVGEQEFRFYEHWYLPAIRELVCLRHFGDDYHALAKALVPSILPAEAKAALKTLLDLGFLAKAPRGGYRQTDPLLSTGFEVKSLAVRNFNQQMAQLSKEAIETMPASERNVTGITMGISERTYHLIEEEIRGMQERILRLLEKDQQADRVYQLQVSLFPLSRPSSQQEG